MFRVVVVLSNPMRGYPGEHADRSDPSIPSTTYPPPANAVAPNPYAQANPAGGAGGNYNQYAQAPSGNGYQENPYAGQYGQQEQYAMGGANGAAGGDFWSEVRPYRYCRGPH
jgi:hypothetical protein